MTGSRLGLTSAAKCVPPHEIADAGKAIDDNTLQDQQYDVGHQDEQL